VISLSDDQLQIVMAAARPLAVEKRDTFLQRVAAELGRVRRPGDRDVDALLPRRCGD
jgi:hypothetical protein